MAAIGGSRDGCRVYLITPPNSIPRRLPNSSRKRLIRRCRRGAASSEGRGRRCLAPRDRRIAPGDAVSQRGFLLNDRADLVRATGCDGAHVGQDDMPAKEARG